MYNLKPAALTAVKSGSDKVLMEFQELEKTYQLGPQKVHALRGINFAVHAGEFIAVAGPSGSGKSTLLNLLALIDTPTKGKVLFEGLEVNQLSDHQITAFRNKKIGIVFQHYNLIPVLSAVENVAFALQVQSVPRAQSLEKAKAMLEEVGLGTHTNFRPAQLSGGQKQRVAIARALVTNPEIIIADEPTAALDSKTGMEIIGLMKNLNQAKKTTFVFSTHDPRIIESVDQVIKIQDGFILN
jgi:putative ABC transport system ATP-binding protein